MKTSTENKIINSLKGSKVTTTVMHKLFIIFKKSINQMNNDQKYWIDKLQYHNEIGQALSEHLKELTEEMAGENVKECDESKQSWKIVLKEQQRNLESLREIAEYYLRTTATLLKKLD
ncbi:MAG: hypothetical protein KAQ62_09520 [Cyclobacteriaceae bacterium]|nr:hypothetical protein [Cyclobacteriaceae bacterium]MCK5368782.1 hypothetical protein [Cyclobacteriaceae bacterium]